MNCLRGVALGAENLSYNYKELKDVGSLSEFGRGPQALNEKLDKDVWISALGDEAEDRSPLWHDKSHNFYAMKAVVVNHIES